MVGSIAGEVVGTIVVSLFGDEVGFSGGFEVAELAQDVNATKQKIIAAEIALTRLTNIEYPS